MDPDLKVYDFGINVFKIIEPHFTKTKQLSVVMGFTNSISIVGKVKLRFNRLASQNYKSIKRALQKIILELLKRSIV